MLSVFRTAIFPIAIIIVLSALLICNCASEALGQEAQLDSDILKYQENVIQKPNDAKAHKELGNAYAKKGLFDKASDEFGKAMEIEYNRGYEAGKENATRREGLRVYGGYLVLSIAGGLFVAAVIVAVLAWPDMTDRFKSAVRSARIRAFVNSTKAKLSPELRKRAIEIAQSKEKLRDAIDRESELGLAETAAGVLPRLDDLARQASLLLGLRQNLSDYIRDIDPIKLEAEKRDAEEKLRRETDEEAKRALGYHLQQLENKRANYSKAQAKIRTCDSVLGGIFARIDATSLDLLSLPSVLIRKQEFLEKVSAELDEEISLARDATETVTEKFA